MAFEYTCIDCSYLFIKYSALLIFKNCKAQHKYVKDNVNNCVDFKEMLLLKMLREYSIFFTCC